jgi:hypothetical protein
VLDGTGDAQSNIDAGMHGLAGLADLMVSRQPAFIGNGTGSTDNAAQGTSQLFGQGNALFGVRADTTANGNNHISTDQVNQLLSALLDVQDLNMDIVSSQSGGNLLNNNLGSTSFVERLGLHNAGAHGGHLRAEARADDGGHQVAAECGTGHLQVGVLFKLGVVHINGGGGAQEVLILGDIHIQVGAVSSQAGVQAGCAAGAKVTAQVGSANQHNFRLFLHDEVTQNLGIAIGGVVLQQGAVDIVNAVCAVAAESLEVVLVDLAAHHNAAQLNAKVVGQFAAFTQQLIADGLYLAFALFAEYPHALEGGGVHCIEFSHCTSLLSQIRCLSFRMPTSWAASSTIMPAPLTGGAKDL